MLALTDKPPSAVLQIQGIEQKLYGEYFFRGVNSDDFIALTSRKALVTASPFSATLKFAADKPSHMLIFTTGTPQAVSIKVADAAALGKPGRELYGSEPSFSWNGRDFANHAILTKDLDLKNEQTFTLELKHGLYIITVSANWFRGWAHYSFLVDVK
jgi:hypothetical protein